VAERRVTEIVAKGDRLGQFFVQPEDFGDRSRNLRDLEAVREPCAVMIAYGAKKTRVLCFNRRNALRE
jgi:hypothetical protein